MSRRLILTRYSAVPIAHIAPAVVENLVAAQASIAATFHRTWVAHAQKLALLLASYHRQRFNRLSSPIASVAKIYTNKLN